LSFRILPRQTVVRATVAWWRPHGNFLRDGFRSREDERTDLRRQDKSNFVRAPFGRKGRALAQRVEIDAQELRIMGSKSELLRTLVAASSAKTAGLGPEVARHGR
jgi:hypothetical protein